MKSRLFSVEEARALMPEVRRVADQLVTARADLAEISRELRDEGGSAAGGVPEVKALEAQVSELVGWYSEQGIEVKGVAPLLVDFPAELDGVSVRLCWLEGEDRLDWYHRSDLGIVGRRRIPES
ncbi:MAG: DUF2203 family protein [Pseudonocardiaceae bacterium]|nr:DUF2203 family protein [Pseudonocardiaceae bacterium]